MAEERGGMSETTSFEGWQNAEKFLQESKSGRYIVITDGDEIGAFVFGDMSKAELVGMLEIAKLMLVDQI